MNGQTLSGANVLVGHVVDAGPAPRVAAANAADREVGAFDATVFAQGFHRVGRAGRVEPAAMANPWAEHQTVKPDRERHDESQRGHCFDIFRKAPLKSARSASKGRLAVTSFLPIST